MADIFREVDEDLRQQRYAELWRKYGSYVIGGAVAIVLAVAAAEGWRSYSASVREGEGLRFARADELLAQGGREAATAEFATLAAEASSGYGILARFREAALRAEAGDAEGAVRVYEEIANDGGVEPQFRDLAVVFLAAHTLEAADAVALRTRLAPIVAEGNPWRHSARELDGLLAERAGRKDEAQRIFEDLAADATAPPGLRARAGEVAAVLAE